MREEESSRLAAARKEKLPLEIPPNESAAKLVFRGEKKKKKETMDYEEIALPADSIYVRNVQMKVLMHLTYFLATQVTRFFTEPYPDQSL